MKQEILVGDVIVESLTVNGVASGVFAMYELGRTLHVKVGELVLLECPKQKFLAEVSVIFVKEIAERNAQVLVFQTEE